jgi:hypothetical protein
MTHPTHPDHAEAEPTRSQAMHAFGGAGGALLDELVRQFGPILAQVILRWLMARQQAGEIPQHALLDMNTLRAFLANEIESHKQAILAAADAQLEHLLDVGIVALRS